MKPIPANIRKEIIKHLRELENSYGQQVFFRVVRRHLFLTKEKQKAQMRIRELRKNLKKMGA